MTGRPDTRGGFNALLNHPDVKRVLRCMAEAEGHPVYPSWFEEMSSPNTVEEED
jgi:hypothetical protein